MKNNQKFDPERDENVLLAKQGLAMLSSSDGDISEEQIKEIIFKRAKIFYPFMPKTELFNLIESNNIFSKKTINISTAQKEEFVKLQSISKLYNVAYTVPRKVNQYIKIYEHSIFDEIDELMKKSKLSSKILKKFSIFSIVIGIGSMFMPTKSIALVTCLIAIVIGIVAKRDKQKLAVVGIIIGIFVIVS
jgi:hypothetical protein